MKCRTRRIVVAYVRWFDSSISSQETSHVDDVAGILENESSGILIREDKKSITLALDRCLDTDGVRSTLCIPKANVRSIRRFTVRGKRHS